MLAPPDTRGSSRRDAIVAACIVLPLLAAAVWFVQSAEFTSWDFRNNLWGPAHLLVQGMSPYAIEQIFDGSNSVWMPVAVGAGFALGWLEIHTATNLWLLLNVLLVLTLVGLSIQRAQPGTLWVSVALLAALLFPPTISHLILGQFSLLTAVLLLLAVRRLESLPRWPVLAGLLLALSLTKPQLVLLPGLGIIWWMWRRAGGHGLLRLALMVGVWVLVLLLPLWLGYSDWLQGFRAALERNQSWAHPTLFLRLTTAGTVGWLLWGLLAALALAVNIWLWERLPARRAVGWSLALNLLVTPYAWSWDFVLLLPLWVQVMFALERRDVRALLLAAYALCWAGIVYVRLTTDNDDVRYWWVPPVMLALLTAAHIASRWRGAPRPAEAKP